MKMFRKLFPPRSMEVALTIGGLGCIAWGLFLIYQPLAFICAGAVMLAEVFTSKGRVG